MPSSVLDSLVSFLHSLGHHLAARLAQILNSIRENQASAGLAAVSAFAISIFFAWRLARYHPGGSRPSRRPKPGDPQRPTTSGASRQDPSTSGLSAQATGAYSSSSGLGAASGGSSLAHLAGGHSQAAVAATPLALSVRKQLAGAQRVTCHIPGVLLRQASPAELQNGATLIPAAAEALLEICRHADTYLMAQVDDDSSEVAILSALEAGGILGPKSPFNSSKLLFCSTDTGVMSFVRQLEPDLHIESSLCIVDQLKRFVKRELYITRASSGAGPSPSAAPAAANVVSALSLEAYFGPPSNH